MRPSKRRSAALCVSNCSGSVSSLKSFSQTCFYVVILHYCLWPRCYWVLPWFYIALLACFYCFCCLFFLYFAKFFETVSRITFEWNNSSLILCQHGLIGKYNMIRFKLHCSISSTSVTVQVILRVSCLIAKQWMHNWVNEMTLRGNMQDHILAYVV